MLTRKNVALPGIPTLLNQRHTLAGQTFESLIGDWTIKRSITHYPQASKGSASFTRREDRSLIYQERIILEHPSGTLEGFRCYAYRLVDSSIEIYFADGSDKGALFMSLSFIEMDTNKSTVTVATGTHQCKHDLYAANFRFINEHSFSVIYTVKGPKKDYQIATCYSR